MLSKIIIRIPLQTQRYDKSYIDYGLVAAVYWKSWYIVTTLYI